MPVHMEEHVVVKVSQKFLLFCGCSSKEYTITLQRRTLNLDSNYFVHYIFPTKSVEKIKAEAVTEYELLVKDSPEFDHPCTVQVEVYSSDNDQCMGKFSLDLLSPVEYLYRSLSLDDKEASNKMSHKMNSALLAMTLSYYYVMGADVQMEGKADEILSTLLGNNALSTKGQKVGNSTNIIQFAQRYQLHNTLHCLAVEDENPVQSSKVLLPEHNESRKLSTKPRVLPRRHQNIYHQSIYTRLTGEFKPGTDQSDYTPLIHDQAQQQTEEPKRVQKINEPQRDQLYEEIISDYEEIEDELLYAEPKNVQPYEKPVISKTKEERPYDTPCDATDEPLQSPIYIVPDLKEQQNTDINGEHNASENGSGKHQIASCLSANSLTHRRSKSMEFLDYNETKLPPPGRPPPPDFSRKGVYSELSPITKYNTISRCEKRNIMQTLSAFRPFKSGRSSPQPNERSFAKRDLSPSPKPRSSTKAS